MAHNLEWDERERKLYLDFHLGIAKAKRDDKVGTLRLLGGRCHDAYTELWEAAWRTDTGEDDTAETFLKDALKIIQEVAIELNHVLTPDH